MTDKNCPLVAGPCQRDACHFWVTDVLHNKHNVPWPNNLPRPEFDAAGHGIEAGQELYRLSQAALAPLIGTDAEGGKVTAAAPVDRHLREIRLSVDVSVGGDCAIHRLGERGSKP